MTQLNAPPKIKVKSVSYSDYEVDTLSSMEGKLQRHLGMNYSQLHKHLIREKFSTALM